MSISLDNFITDMEQSILDFKKYWKDNNHISPDLFPMEFNDDNSGTWLEQFLIFKGM